MTCKGCRRTEERTVRGWRRIRVNAKGLCAACQDAAAEAKRYIVMSVPLDSDGALWFVYDLKARRSSKQLESFAAARSEAARLNASTSKGGAR